MSGCDPRCDCYDLSNTSQHWDRHVLIIFSASIIERCARLTMTGHICLDTFTAARGQTAVTARLSGGQLPPFALAPVRGDNCERRQCSVPGWPSDTVSDALKFMTSRSRVCQPTGPPVGRRRTRSAGADPIPNNLNCFALQKQRVATAQSKIEQIPLFAFERRRCRHHMSQTTPEKIHSAMPCKGKQQ